MTLKAETSGLIQMRKRFLDSSSAQIYGQVKGVKVQISAKGP